MTGYTGKGLRVDLSTGKTYIIVTPVSLCADFIGGRGFGVKMISDRITLSYDDADMPLIFATGPLVGTAAPTSGRMSVISRSPLTDTVFDCSVGGRFGTELKRAGYDFIEITGKSSQWVSMIIKDSNVSLVGSDNLKGFTTSETSASFGNMSCAAIGPAGENLVRYASIVFDKHYCAGRGGLGAVMGSKKLKAVAVKGSSAISVMDTAALDAARKEIMRLLRASQAVFGEFGLSEFGTAALVDLIHSRRMEPTQNFRKTIFDNASEYSGYRMKERYKTRKEGCSGCPVLCKKISSNGEVMPEFETVSHFGALNNCSDLEAIVKSNTICNEMGIDSITAASTIACYSEIEGISVTAEQMHDLLRRISIRSCKLADALAEGSYRYAESKGAPEMSMSVKKLELPAYDPRGAYGMALAYATSNRGGCHLRAYPVSHEILRRPVATDRFSFEGKARIIRISEDLNAVVDSLTACKFVFFGASLEEFAKAFNSVTGSDHNSQSLLKAGERIWNLERRLNEMNGFTKSDDDLPARFFIEDGSSSEMIKISAINREDFLNARNNYYRIRGW
ncbi:MAG: aldehyde ferredoxin oxidoreductase family protein [Nitrospirae bacterium]|nr:aldehyde ferredoxin oxidoreductase family protein [Nitrospirota bacterium]